VLGAVAGCDLGTQYLAGYALVLPPIHRAGRGAALAFSFMFAAVAI